jgi:3-oxoacyl-[acyl-carrier-protein] synthase II
MSKKKRVVITGMGAVSPAGVGINPFWETLKEGQSCVEKITRFDASEEYDCQVAAEIKNFNAENYIDRQVIKKTDRSTHYALIAAREAIENSHLEISKEHSDRIGISMGIAVFGVDFLEQQFRNHYKKGLKAVSPYSTIAIFCCGPLGHLSIELGIHGPGQTFSNGCTASTDAIGHALQSIQKGEVDIALAGGTDAPITPLTMYSFDVIHCLARGFNHEPEKASRPFDKKRSGFVMGEGCGMIVLEELEHALRRGAHIHAEITGFGTTCNAYHMTAPAPDGEQSARSIALALQDAGKDADDVHYINAHGTSTPLNCKTETLAIKKVFGDSAYHIPISSIKSMIGHPLGGAGAMQVISTALTIESGVISPTINYENPDPECDLDYVPNHYREGQIDVALINNFGFSGKNSNLVLERFSKNGREHLCGI